MRSLFCNFSTSPNVNNLSSDYSVCTSLQFKKNSANRILINISGGTGVQKSKVTKLKSKWLKNIKSFLNCFYRFYN